MNNVINSLPAANLFGSLFGAVLAISLFKARDFAADKFLAAVLLVASVALSCISLDHGRFLPLSALPEHIEFGATLATGPLLYFYIRTATSRTFVFRRLHLLHWAPVVLYLAGVGVISSYGGVWEVPVEVIMAHQLSYTVLAAGAYLSEHRGHESGAEGRITALPRALLFMFAAIHLAQLARLSFSKNLLLREIVPLVGTMGFYALCLARMRYLTHLLRDRHPDHRPKYHKSSLGEEAARRHLAALISLLEAERLYTDPKLTLSALAKRVGIPRQHLSQVINQQLDQGFFDFVNGYRIEEVKKKLLDPASDRFTIDSLAFDAGFTSRSGFYSAFKKLTGMTPSQFRRTRNGRVLKPDAPPAGESVGH